MPGHITPLLHLCQHLAASGCLVTLLKAPKNSQSSGVEKWDNGVRIRSCLPLEPTKPRPAVHKDDHGARLEEVLCYFNRFQALNDDDSMLAIAEELSQSSGVPISCVISDVYVGWARDLAAQLEVPWIALWTSTVAELLVYHHMPRLIERGIFPFAGDPSDEEFSIPGLPPLLPKNYPTFGFIPYESLHKVLHTYKELVHKIPQADRVLVNSIEGIEEPAVDSLIGSGINIKPIGPLHLLSDKLGTSAPQGEDCKKEPSAIIQWLGARPDSSVIYVAFGTTMSVANGQFEELASALEESRQEFVWAIRDSSLIPPGFQERMSKLDQGLVVSWAPQLEILGHRSVGGFLTHCGWNSVVESMSFGMPMVARPITGDQVLTAKFVIDEWGIGVGVRGIELGRELARKDDLKNSIKALMEADPKTSEIWKNARRVKEVVRAAMKNKGSSRNNLDSLVCDLHERVKAKRVFI
ncbi:anthocyanidin 3-O-glucosyltransferase 7 [Selaginella moellendorffii]|nr:anthocyanidin 3-O-glucosyltransferase 7 [Selaginella moellendorffii]|eukprot:XP_002983688.2 anthocyanidin 3-O-glucosyltransferase 7 [Selaginella moellendorffii]